MVLLEGEVVVFRPFIAPVSIPSYTEGNLWLDPTEYSLDPDELPPSNGSLTVAGQLYVNVIMTNYRLLLFRTLNVAEFVPFASIPYFLITNVTKVGSKKSKSAYGVSITLITPLQFVLFLSRAPGHRSSFVNALVRQGAQRLTITHQFPCFVLFTSPKTERGWFIYNPFEEYARMGVGTPSLDVQKFMAPFAIDKIKRPLGTLGIKAIEVRDGIHCIATGNPKLMVCLHEYEERKAAEVVVAAGGNGAIKPAAFWSLTDANFDYCLCDTYPFLLAVPTAYASGEKQESLQLVAGNRSHRRLPVLAWKDKDDEYGAILRSSQPYNPSKKSEKRFVADREYLQHIWAHYGSLHRKDRLLVIDARTKTNMQMNQLIGRGTEGYPFVQVEFLDLPGCQYVRQRHLADCSFFALTQDMYQYYRFAQRRSADACSLDPRKYVLKDTKWMNTKELQTPQESQFSQQDECLNKLPASEGQPQLQEAARVHEYGVDHEETDNDVSEVERLSPSLDFNSTAIFQYSNNGNVDHSAQSGSAVVMARVRTSGVRQLEEVHRLLIAGAVSICENVIRGTVVLVHCSDGWDRTAQLVSLSMLMLDPYYRTLRGFFILIEKEWCSFGHRFSSRCGILQVSNQDQESLEEAEGGDLSSSLYSPVFIQFLEIVSYLLDAYPSEFEFTEEVLKYIAYHTYSARFGTFIGDCELDRLLCQLPIRTTSIWDQLLESKGSEKYLNKDYTPGSVLDQHSWAYLKLNCNKQLPAWKGFWEQHIPVQ